MQINQGVSRAVTLERIANLPKEIFQAESNLNQKLMRLAVESKLQANAEQANARILDTYA